MAKLKSSKRGSGFFISFEGGEGAGKTTQIRLLAAWLKREGYTVTLTRQPGGTAMGKKIRSLLLTPTSKEFSPRAEVLLYAADRAQHVLEVIEPALAEGHIVITDRYSDSSVVYQGFCRGLGEKTVALLNHYATKGLEPDLVFVLDVPVTTALRRVRARTTLDRMELEKKRFHEKVRAGFLRLAHRSPKRFAVLDSAQPPEAVSHQVRLALMAKLKRRGLWNKQKL